MYGLEFTCKDQAAEVCSLCQKKGLSDSGQRLMWLRQGKCVHAKDPEVTVYFKAVT